MERFTYRRFLLQHNTTSTSSSPAPISSHACHSGSPYDPSAAAFTALVLFSFLSFLGFFSLYARRVLARDVQSHQYHHHARVLLARSDPAAAKKGLDLTALRALPVFPYSGRGGGGGGTGTSTSAFECVVCLSEFEEGESVKVIPSCGHLFHPQCIDAWLASRGSCPVCRFDVAVEGEDGGSGAGRDCPAAVVREGPDGAPMGLHEILMDRRRGHT